MELEKKVHFSQGTVAPLCVPNSAAFEDRPDQAYVGGWGTSKNKCDTNDFGPNPHSVCKFPFQYRGQVFNKCSRMPTPAAMNPVCNELFKWAQKQPTDVGVF